MTRLRFVDSFWDDEFLGSRGYEILLQRLKSGRKMCKEIDEYIKERIKAEQAYSKCLLGAVKKLSGFDEMGDLGRSVLQLQKETEKICGIHELAAKQYLALQRELTEFNTDQNNRRHSADDAMKKQIQAKTQACKQAQMCKERYIHRCRERDNAENTYINAKQSVTVKTKDLEKMDRNKEKANESMENADQAYKSSINQLEQTRHEWEKEMERVCHTFESLEEGRIEMVRDMLWRCTNIESQACVDHDQCAENVRQKLEMCDIDKDLKDFINKNKTGSERPAQILYENYYDRRNSATTSIEISRTTQKPLVSGRPAQQIPSEVSKHPRPQPPARPVEQNKPFVSEQRTLPKEQPLISFDDNDSMGTESGYSSVNVTEMRSDRITCTVTRTYISKNPAEHSVQQGEVIELVNEVPGSAIVKVMKNGRIGIIPKSCIHVPTMAYV